MMSPSTSFQIRNAKSVDQNSIQSLIRKVGINPLGLDWRRFYVAVDQGNRIIGCGQIKLHQDGSRELASIAVDEKWRNRGIATRIIQQLLQEGEGYLWLMCRKGLVPFYERFGFKEVDEKEKLPPYFRRIMRIWGIFDRISGHKQMGSVMVNKRVLE